MIFLNLKKTFLLSLLSLCVSTPALADDISGAGATFPHPLYAKWAEAYKKETGLGLNYQAIGSGGGIKQIKARTVTFGATDKPLNPEELNGSGLVQWPMVIGGVVPVVNVQGINAGDMVLDGATIADIYLGETRYWDDPAIAKINPKLHLPHQQIVQVYRADGSGTNFLFTNYLSSVNRKFQQKVGADASVQWPAGIGAKGNEGVASMTTRTAGAIGYVEYSYVVQNKMVFTKMVNKDGKIVAPEFAAFQAAAANANWTLSDGFYLILTNQSGANSWPITGASFILMPTAPSDKVASKKALDFFAWAYKNGNDTAKSLDYVPMPENVAKLAEKSWEKIDLK